MKMTTLALLGTIAGAGILGCEADVYTPRPAAAVEVDYGTPVVYDSYYVGGHYDGPYWTWHDHDGHVFRERREFHERRFAEHQRGGEGRAVERHEEHHDDHR
jgi:hypothetical protein